MATARINSDPKTALKGALPPIQSNHHASITRRYLTDSMQDATWTADSVLALGVYDDGSPRNGLTEHACNALYDCGYKGRDTMVKVIDYGILLRDEKWVKLGKAHCL